MERPKNPATTEPPIPIKIVITAPPGSRPGTKSFATTPTNDPTKIIHSIICSSFHVDAPAMMFVVDLAGRDLEFETCHIQECASTSVSAVQYDTLIRLEIVTTF